VNGTSEPAGAAELLRDGEIEVKGRLPWSSNASFLVELRLDDRTCGGVYKPVRGERPLWDFPAGLHRREVAAWELSDALGWGLVPPTLIREGPLGEGSVQLFVPADFEEHYFTLYEDDAHHDALRAICAFDLVANNTDRKSGHCLLGGDGRIYAIDHGLCFHVESKIRTVIWEFGGEAVPDPLLADLDRVGQDPPDALVGLLSPAEIDALAARARALVRRGVFPEPDPHGRCYPWPLV
jgi:uncharacterized repeat protein (TIGR03843 family)